MGCHTWFYRPITNDEFRLIREYAPTEIYNLTGKTEENVLIGAYDKVLYNSLMKSYNENIPCVYGLYWWELGWGSGNPDFLNGSAMVRTFKKHGQLYVNVPEYSDIFRVYNYPRKKIKSRRQLRRWMRKKYFDLNQYQLGKISTFFKENPGGIISFG